VPDGADRPRTVVPPAPFRRLTRHTEDGELAGVCAGLGVRFGQDPVLFRVAFVTSIALGGLGLLLYAIAWGAIPRAQGAPTRPPRRDLPRLAGLVLISAAGLAVLNSAGLWWGPAAWPVLLAGIGLAILYGPGGAFRDGGRIGSLRTWWSDAPGTAGRAVLGALLVLAGGVAFLQLTGRLVQTGRAIGGLAVLVLALALVFGPWLARLVRTLGAERAARIRSQERAEVGAHLHDSVLQTLALIQRRADSPREVATLARKQERELRAWLAGDGDRPLDATLVTALEDTAAEVEETFDVTVDVVAVGDRPLGDCEAALLAAAREAMVNAARFAGEAGPISVYVEATDTGLEVFVRDRGPGFDPAAVPADRRGVRESILGRMERHGGWATIEPAPGGGTEVALRLTGAGGSPA
jgi:signal transduction histidine kinase